MCVKLFLLRCRTAG